MKGNQGSQELSGSWSLKLINLVLEVKTPKEDFPPP
jgi:hypothetical protein